jgi:spermidine/putrescine-binding protein
LDDFNALAKKLDAAAPTYTVKSIVDAVQAALIQLKSDSFGLEVDSGKTDIISGDKSGIDTAWSGDAVTSLNNADELGNTLYYSIPKTGGNIWFDAWVLIKRDGLEQEYAQKFIDFISRPDIAAANMDYIGYTSFIAGDDILDSSGAGTIPATARCMSMTAPTTTIFMTTMATKSTRMAPAFTRIPMAPTGMTMASTT